MKTRIIFISFTIFLFASIPLSSQSIIPDSVITNGRSHEIYAQGWIPSHKALGGNIFIGTSFLNSNYAEYFSNPFFIGINVDIHRNRIVFQVDDYIGFGATRRTLEFNPTQKWEAGKSAFSFMLGGNIGYSIFDNKHFEIVPLTGVGFTLLSSKFYGSSDFSEHEPFLPHFKFGVYMDFKSLVLLQDHVRINGEDENYTSLRLSFGVTNNIGNPKYDEFYRGATFYVTVGMGGLSRDFTKDESKPMLKG